MLHNNVNHYKYRGTLTPHGEIIADHRQTTSLGALLVSLRPREKLTTFENLHQLQKQEIALRLYFCLYGAPPS